MTVNYSLLISPHTENSTGNFDAVTSVLNQCVESAEDNDLLVCHLCQLTFTSLHNKQSHYCSRTHTDSLWRELNTLMSASQKSCDNGSKSCDSGSKSCDGGTKSCDSGAKSCDSASKSCENVSKSCDSGTKSTNDGGGNEIVTDNKVGISYEGEVKGEGSSLVNDRGCGQQDSNSNSSCGEEVVEKGNDRGADMSRDHQCSEEGERSGMEPGTENTMECGQAVGDRDLMAVRGLPVTCCVESCERGDGSGCSGDVANDTRADGCGLEQSGCGQLESVAPTTDNSRKMEDLSTSSEDHPDHGGAMDCGSTDVTSMGDSPDIGGCAPSCNGPVHLSNGDGGDGPQSVPHGDSGSGSLVEWARDYAGMSIDTISTSHSLPPTHQVYYIS